MFKFRDIEGAQQLKARLESAGKSAVYVLAQALHAEAQMMMNVSREQYVPVDYGILRGSGVVKTPEISGTIATVTFGYGGAAKAYAIVQHEDESLHHPPKNPRRRTGTRRSARPGQAKYLERPVVSLSRGMERRMAEFIRRRGF